MESYSTGEVSKMLGIDLKRLVGFISRRLLIPEKESGGRGRPAVLSSRNVVEAAVLVQLSDIGMDLGKAAPIARAVAQGQNSFDFGVISMKVDIETVVQDALGIYGITALEACSKGKTQKLKQLK